MIPEEHPLRADWRAQVRGLARSLARRRAQEERAAAELRAAADARAECHSRLVAVRRRVAGLGAELSRARAEARDLEREDRRLGQVAERRRAERDAAAEAAEALEARLDGTLAEALAAAKRDGWAEALAGHDGTDGGDGA